MNIRFNYLYRDYSNYKNHGSVIFSNPNNLSLEEIETAVREKLIDGEWFYHHQWNVPDLHFEKTDWEDDHPYHEFSSIEPAHDSTAEPPKAIDEFLLHIHSVPAVY